LYKVVVERLVFIKVLKNLKSRMCILVLVVDIMLKSLLLKKLELLYKDNLIKCDTKSNLI
jgi:hypothetical protein